MPCTRVLPLFLALGLAGCAHLPWNAPRIRQAQARAFDAPESAQSWVALGDAYRRAHSLKKARAAYNNALRLDPQNTAARQGLAALRSGGGVNRLERKVMKQPANDELWGDLADAYALRGDRDTALRYYLHALSIDPTDSEWLQAVVGMGGTDQLLQLFQDRMQADPDNDEIMGDYADLLFYLQRRDEACMAWQRAHQLDPQDTEWNDRLTQCASNGLAPGGSAPAAGGGSLVEVLEARLEADPTNVDTLVALGDTVLEQGEPERALGYYQRALDQQPGSLQWVRKVTALSGEPLLPVLQRLADAHPTDDEVWGNLGDHLLELGRNADALTAYRKARALDPEDEEWVKQVKLLEGSLGR